MAGTKPGLRRGSVSALLTRIWLFARCGGQDLDFETSTRLHLPLIPCAQETTTRLQQARERGRSVSLRSKRENKRRFPCMCSRCSSLPPPLLQSMSIFATPRAASKHCAQFHSSCQFRSLGGLSFYGFNIAILVS
jgi:hypothetical protein